MDHESLIVSAIRSPIGALGGALASVPAPELGASCIAAALRQAELSPDDVHEVIMGNVVGAGIGQNPARQAAIAAGIPDRIGAMTINKVCGSGLKAVMLADQSIRLGESRVVVAGGMENMSRAPYLLLKAREGYRLGNGELIDSVIHDGLWDAYGGRHMGVYGDQCAAKFDFSRQKQDDFAVRSYERARRAIDQGWFQSELAPVEIKTRKGVVTVSVDEEPARFDEAKLRSLRPAFGQEGTITAGNASSINDGAAALVIASNQACSDNGLRPIGRIVGSATFSREPQWFTIAPIDAIRCLLEKVDWTIETTDLLEINEAFSAVAMAAAKELHIPDEKLNIFGGAVALGHPIGSSGARILVTLLSGLKRTGGTRGIACLCIGGGEAVAVAVETLP